MVMEKNEIPSMTPFPQVLKVLGDGCNLVANNAKLMILPLVLDLLLLFGPRLRIAEYFGPIFESAYGQMIASVPKSAASQLETAQALLLEFLDSINLFGMIRIFPIGVNLLNSSGSDVTPLGNAASYEMSSILQIIPVMIVMIIFGILIGTLYFSVTAKTAAREGKYSIGIFGKQLLNTVLFYLAMIILMGLLFIPVSCVMTFSFMAAPFLYQIVMILIIAAGCWLIIPLFYIPHGIFVKHFDLTQAITESIRLSSWSGPVTIRFIIFSIVLSMGLDLIWAIPEQNSWLILISIFGHAFISTALLAASFLLFTELEKWQADNQEFLTWRKANLRINKLFKKEPEQHD